jgi:hypothetical protein
VAVTAALLIGVTLLLQRALGVPGGPTWAGLVLLPAVWIAGPALRSAGRRWVWVAMVMGLGWDLLMEPIVGPGGIAWSAAALAVIRLAGIVADRSSKAWFAFGGLAAAVMLAVQRLTLLPLGVDVGWRLTDLGLSAVATAVWCGVVGWIISLDVPSRWRAWRARKLR